MADENDWTFCAYETERCRFPDDGYWQVRYGKGDVWTNPYLLTGGGVDCNNDNFFNPIVSGATKECYIQAASSPRPVATPAPPAPVPLPATAPLPAPGPGTVPQQAPSGFQFPDLGLSPTMLLLIGGGLLLLMMSGGGRRR